MRIIQKIVSTILPASMVESMRAETNEWQLRCTGCGTSKLLWEAGGIRYRKSTNESISMTLVRCQNCGGFRKAFVEASQEAPIPEPLLKTE